MKYKITISKYHSEKHSSVGESIQGLVPGQIQQVGFREREIFSADINSDNTIEILQHLHDCKERERQENTPQESLKTVD